MEIKEGVIYCYKETDDENFIKGRCYIIRRHSSHNDDRTMEICDFDGTHIAQFDRNILYNKKFLSKFFITLKEYRKQKLEKILKQ